MLEAVPFPKDSGSWPLVQADGHADKDADAGTDADRLVDGVWMMFLRLPCYDGDADHESRPGEHLMVMRMPMGQGR